MRSNSGREIRQFFLGGGMPATMFLLAANVFTFLGTFFLMRTHPAGPFWWMSFSPMTWPKYPWTIVTWPLVAPCVTSQDLINLIFGVIWMFWIGGSLERSWGTRIFLAFLTITSALSALTLWLGGWLLGAGFWVQGLWLAAAAPTIAWCIINRGEVIRLYFILPVSTTLLAWFTVAMTWFTFSVNARHPLLGLFALSGCAVAYWYVKGGRYALSRMGTRSNTPVQSERLGGYGPRDRESIERTDGFSLMRWWRERQQRKRLEAMFRRSGLDDEQKKGR